MSTATAVTMLDVRAGSGAITLPLTTQIPYRVITIKDAYGAAGLSSITINTQGTDVFENGTSSITLTNAYDTTTLYAGLPGYWYTVGGSRLQGASFNTLSTGVIVNPLRLGTISTQTSIQFPGLRQGYTGTIVAEQTTGLGTQELLLYKASSISDQIRLQTTGNIIFEAGASARSFPSTAALATPTLFIQGSTSNVGIGTAAPAATLDVAGTGRFQTLSSFALNVSSINGAAPGGTFNGSTIALSTGSVYASNIMMSGPLNMNTNVISNAGTITESTYVSNMVLWFDGNDSTTLFQDGGGTTPVTADNQSVYLWKDKSVYATNATAVTTSYSAVPKSTYGSQNSKNGIYFGGTSGFQFSSANMPGGTTSNATYFFVAKQSSSSPPGQSFAYPTTTVLFTTGNRTQSAALQTTQNNGGMQVYTDNISPDGGSNWTNSVPYIQTLVVQSGQIIRRANGLQLSLTTITGAVAANTGTGRISETFGSFYNYWNGQVYEVLVYNTPLLTIAMQEIEGYLAWKWGITLNVAHPYYAVSPGITPNPSGTLTQFGSFGLDTANNIQITATNAIRLTGAVQIPTTLTTSSFTVSSINGLAVPTQFTGSTNFLSASLVQAPLLSTLAVNVSSINGAAPWQPSFLTSTVQGLGTAGYISTAAFQSTVAGINYAISQNTVDTVFYLNPGTAATTYRQMSPSQTTFPQSTMTTFITRNTSNIPIAQFQTDFTVPQVIPDGAWDLNLFAYTDHARTFIYTSLFSRAGATETLIASSSNATTNIGTSPVQQYTNTLFVPQTIFTSTTGVSLVLKVFANNPINQDDNLYTYYQGGTYSHTHTTFGTVVPDTLFTSTVAGLGTAGYVSTLVNLRMISSLEGYVSSFRTDSLTVGGPTGFVTVQDLTTATISTGQIVAGAGFISSLQINSLSFGPSGYVIVGDVIANSLSTTRLNTQALYANNAYIGNVSSQSAILFPGIDGNYRGTAVAERTTGTGTGELLLYKVSSTTDQIRLQTTGNIVFEAGAASRSWNSTTQLATPTLYIAGSTSNVGVGTAAPAATLDVAGTGRFQVVSSFALNVSSINGAAPGGTFNGSTTALSTAIVTTSTLATNSAKTSSLTMYGTLNMSNNLLTNIYSALFAPTYSGNPNNAAGGIYTIYTSGSIDYAVHAFKTVGTTTFTANATITGAQILVIGGGGSGGGGAVGGGGGAGGLVYATGITITPATYSIVVGGGGVLTNNPNYNTPGVSGSNSSALGYTGNGGGAGGSDQNHIGANGGCGGGGCGLGAFAGGTGSQGFAGGTAVTGDGGAGGGGMGSIGSVNSGSVGGAGGSGLTYSITGTATGYAAGGGGGSTSGTTPVLGGSANGTVIGGYGGASTVPPTAGAANTGSGGGGQRSPSGFILPGAGGSGIVIIAYPLNQYTYTPYTIGTITGDATSNLSIQPVNNLNIVGTTQTSALLVASTFSTTFINARTISTAALQVSSINGAAPWQPSFLTSTVQGLATAGYISSTQLASTVTNLITRIGAGGGGGGTTFVGSTTFLSATQVLFSTQTGYNISSVLGFVSSLQVDELQIGTGFGIIAFGDTNMSSISTLGIAAGLGNFTTINVSSINGAIPGTGSGGTTFTGTLGTVSSLTALRFFGLTGTYANTAVAEVSTGTGLQELLLYKVSSVSDQVRVQTTGNVIFETGVGARGWPTAPRVLPPTLYIAGSNSNVGIGTSNPVTTLDVVGTGRFQTLSSLNITAGSINYSVAFV